MAIIIPKETLESWKALRGKGDIERLKKILKKDKKAAVYYILQTGKCSSRTVASKLIKFHTDLEKEVQELTQKLDQE